MKLNTKAGERLKSIRLLMGLTQDEMAKLLGVPYMRYSNVENVKVRMAEDEFAAACGQFREFIDYLTFEGDIDSEAVKNSKNAYVRIASANIDAGRIPDQFMLKEKIK